MRSRTPHPGAAERRRVLARLEQGTMPPNPRRRLRVGLVHCDERRYRDFRRRVLASSPSAREVAMRRVGWVMVALAVAAGPACGDDAPSRAVDLDARSDVDASGGAGW